MHKDQAANWQQERELEGGGGGGGGGAAFLVRWGAWRPHKGLLLRLTRGMSKGVFFGDTGRSQQGQRRVARQTEEGWGRRQEAYSGHLRNL